MAVNPAPSSPAAPGLVRAGGEADSPNVSARCRVDGAGLSAGGRDGGGEGRVDRTGSMINVGVSPSSVGATSAGVESSDSAAVEADSASDLPKIPVKSLASRGTASLAGADGGADG